MVSYTVKGTKFAGGWEFAIDGVGTAQSLTFQGADTAIRTYLASTTGHSPDQIEYVCDPPVRKRYTLEELLTFAAPQRHGVLITLNPSGSPQASTVGFMVTVDGAIRIAAVDGRVKVRNVRRDPRVVLHVSDDAYRFVAISGEATVSPVAEDPDDEVADAFVEIYRRANGERSSWREVREQAVRDRRVYLEIRPSGGHGLIAPRR